MSVRAKFHCGSKNPNGGGTDIHLSPVYGGSDENKEFFKATPSGVITLYCTNDAASEQFEIGKEYYVDFTVAA